MRAKPRPAAAKPPKVEIVKEESDHLDDAFADYCREEAFPRKAAEAKERRRKEREKPALYYHPAHEMTGGQPKLTAVLPRGEKIKYYGSGCTIYPPSRVSHHPYKCRCSAADKRRYAMGE